MNNNTNFTDSQILATMNILDCMVFELAGEDTIFGLSTWYDNASEASFSVRHTLSSAVMKSVGEDRLPVYFYLNFIRGLRLADVEITIYGDSKHLDLDGLIQRSITEAVLNWLNANGYTDVIA